MTGAYKPSSPARAGRVRELELTARRAEAEGGWMASSLLGSPGLRRQLETPCLLIACSDLSEGLSSWAWLG